MAMSSMALQGVQYRTCEEHHKAAAWLTCFSVYLQQQPPSVDGAAAADAAASAAAAVAASRTRATSGQLHLMELRLPVRRPRHCRHSCASRLWTLLPALQHQAEALQRLRHCRKCCGSATTAAPALRWLTHGCCHSRLTSINAASATAATAPVSGPSRASCLSPSNCRHCQGEVPPQPPLPQPPC